MRSFAERHYHWNFTLWVLETASWMFGIACIDCTTVLPVLVQSLSGSSLLVGLIVSMRFAGQCWPQLLAASFVSGKPWRKGIYLWMATPGRLLLLWPAVLLLARHTRADIILPALFISTMAFWLSEGISIVPWVDMVGKSIPAGRRGRLFALMYVGGGLLGILAGLLIRRLLSTHPFPVGYGYLFLCAFGGMCVSSVALALLREPQSHPHEERYSTLALIRDIPNLLRAMPQFRLLVILQALFGFSLLPAPWYILYASDVLRRPGSGLAGAGASIGWFLAVQTGGLILGNALWGYLGDRYGNRVLLRVLAGVHMLVPLSALLAGATASLGHRELTYLAFSLPFFGYSGLAGGTWLAVTNFLLELAPEHDRPAYIAVTNALNLPAVLLPLLGGLFLHLLGYHVIFAIATAALCYAFVFTGRLRDPHGTNSA